MIKRDIQHTTQQLALDYPVLMISGPRQSGKTTLAKAIFNEKPYYNLESPDVRERIHQDPRTFFLENSNGAIIDEVQQLPDLLSYIQPIVDDAKIAGQFILTGSCQLSLHQAISQSLAGRVGILDLLPLSLHELRKRNTHFTLDDYLFTGFYPALYSKHTDPTTHYRNYVRTYIERDVRLLINLKDLNRFQRFLQLATSRTGQVLNTESLGNDAGVTGNTIKNWLSVLDASYLTLQLQPYFENFGKRVINSPKLYFTDVGLASYLLGVESSTQLARDRIRGSLFENLVLLELIKTRTNAGKDPNVFYYRDNHGNEVDVIIKQANHLIPIEIKSTATFSKGLLKNLKFYRRLVGDRMPIGFLIYTGETETVVDGVHLINYKNIHRIYEIIEETVSSENQ